MKYLLVAVLIEIIIFLLVTLIVLFVSGPEDIIIKNELNTTLKEFFEEIFKYVAGFNFILLVIFILYIGLHFIVVILE